MNASPSESLLLVERAGPILRLTLNRPAARNALSVALMEALQAALDDAARDSTLRVIIMAANGPTFSAGHDLKEMTAHRADADKGRAAFAALFVQCSKLMQTIVRHPLLVIAQVQGVATAAGCQLVASCDLAVASDAARFATPGVNIGLFCSTPMVALSRNVARKAAMEMLLTGEMIDAQESRRIGLVNRVVAVEALAGETMALAQLIASKPRATVKTGKEAFYRQLEMPLAEAYDYASRVMAENMLHAEAGEGIGAFLEKREPIWPHPLAPEGGRGLGCGGTPRFAVSRAPCAICQLTPNENSGGRFVTADWRDINSSGNFRSADISWILSASNIGSLSNWMAANIRRGNPMMRSEMLF
jgi:enoyl-CoA hydratase/carnithine racemase